MTDNRDLTADINEVCQRHNCQKAFRIEAHTSDGRSAVAYFRKPDRTLYGAALSIESRNPIAAKELVLKSTFLEGDKAILDDDDLFLSACTVIDEMLSVQQADIKKN